MHPERPAIIMLSLEFASVFARARVMSIFYASFDSVQAPKGASTHIAHFARALALGVGPVDLLTLRPAKGFSPLQGEGLRHRLVDASAPHFLDRVAQFRDAVDDALRAARYQAIHVRSIWEGIPAALAARRTGAKLVYEVNGLPSIELKYHYPGVRRNAGLVAKLRRQEEFLARQADLLITPSEVTRGLLETMGAAPERIAVIPNGVDAELFVPPEQEERDGPLRVLYVGTLAPWQGVDTLFDAFKKLLRQTDAALTLIGSGRRSWRKQYAKLARRLHIEERVTFAPAQPPAGVAREIARAQVCAAPLARTERNTRQGCCPIKILEYMACAKPVAASRLPAVRELIEDGETGLLFKPNHAAHLRRRLEMLAESPALRRALGDAARRRVLERFTWDKVCRQLVEQYRRLCGV